MIAVSLFGGLILIGYGFQTTFHYLNYLYINQKCEHNFETGKWRWGKTLLMELVNIGSFKISLFLDVILETLI